MIAGIYGTRNVRIVGIRDRIVRYRHQRSRAGALYTIYDLRDSSCSSQRCVQAVRCGATSNRIVIDSDGAGRVRINSNDAGRSSCSRSACSD